MRGEKDEKKGGGWEGRGGGGGGGELKRKKGRVLFICLLFLNLAKICLTPRIISE